MAGQPSKLGGKVARGFGWATLGGGWSTALLLFAFCYAVAGLAPVTWILPGLVAVAASIVGWLLLRGGKELVQSGADTEHATKTQAILALAATRGGVVTAFDVAQALDVTQEAADAILTRLAKEQMDLVKVDIDDEGRVLYRVTSLAFASMRPPPPMRVSVPGPRVAGAPEAGEAILRPEDEPAENAYGVRAKAR